MVTIAFASFNTTRSRADDGKIKQELGLMRLEAEKSYKVKRTATSVCADTSQFISNLPSGTAFTCKNGAGGYAFEAVLSTGEYYCVDFFGRERTNSASAISNSDFDCR